MQEENGRFQQEIGELKGMHPDFEKLQKEKNELKSIQEQLERLQTGTSHQTSAVLKVLIKS